MTDLIKKALLAGLGASAAAAKAAERELKKLVEMGKINAAEAEKILGQLAEKGSKQVQESRKSLEGLILKSMNKAGIARDRELQDLKRKVSYLEKKIAARKKS